MPGPDPRSSDFYCQMTPLAKHLYNKIASTVFINNRVIMRRPLAFLVVGHVRILSVLSTPDTLYYYIGTLN